MRTERVRVRRDKPGGLRVAFALLLTALMLYLLTLGRTATDTSKDVTVSGGERVTREIEFAALEGHFAQMCACADETDARIEAARYAARGSAGYIFSERTGSESPDAENIYRVLGAGYDTAAAAERTARRLTDEEGIDCSTYTARAEGTLMRVTAPQTAIDALCKAESLLRALPGQLNGLAGELESGASSPGDSRTLLTVLRSEAENALEEIRAIPGWTENPVSAGIGRLLRETADSLEETRTEKISELLNLSGGMRRCGVGIRIGHIEFLRSLAE